MSTVAVLLVVGVVVGVVVFAGKGAGSPQPGHSGSDEGSVSSPSPVVTTCPLTGVDAAGGRVPNRPVLAVKVENLPEARPQTGLVYADIVYEEPVEGGITRFIVLYQCEDASRIEPVRSGRLTDPPILVQYGHPVFGYAGGVPAVIKAVRAAGITDMNFNNAPQAYHRDPARQAPHNLYTSTRALYQAAHRPDGIPQPVFTYSADVPSSATAAASVHVPFSHFSDVFWEWSSSKSEWLRSYGTVPATYSNGQQMAARNVVIQQVRIKMTDITDANGMHSPEVISTGSGRAYILRDGKVIRGTWFRPRVADLTVFKDAQGNEIPLTPGKIWIELVPNNVKVTVR